MLACDKQREDTAMFIDWEKEIPWLLSASREVRAGGFRGHMRKLSFEMRERGEQMVEEG